MMTLLRLNWLTIATLVLALTLPILAQQAQSRYSRAYATDYFDGFESFDVDKRTPQKRKSFWYSVSADSAPAQLLWAREREESGSTRAARKGYEALIREWPTTPQAAEAQLNLAQLYENNGKYEKAFTEYQYLLTFYAGHAPFNEILDRQYRIANHLLHNNRSMFGWLLSNTDTIRERFETIIRNAPRSPIAPEAMLTVGGILVSDDNKEDAISVYDALLNRFSNKPQAIPAAYLAAKCRYELAIKHKSNEPRCRDAIGFIVTTLSRTPDHPQSTSMQEWKSELGKLLIEQNYKQAIFYDTRQRDTAAAKAAYTRFLKEFGKSKYAPEIQTRLEQLEQGAPPLKR